MHDDARSRALVPSGVPSEPVCPAPRPLAAFVTQLFACEARLEPFRSRRRAGSTQGAATYEAAEHGGPAAPARVRRVL
jgi:hypothetical protein